MLSGRHRRAATSPMPRLTLHPAGGGAMTYEVLVIIVVINAIVTLSLWRKVARSSRGRPKLNKKAATALWRSDPIIPKHDPPKTVGGEWSSTADEIDRQFFADFRD